MSRFVYDLPESFIFRASFLLPRTKLDSPTTEIVALKSQGGVDFQTR